MDTKIPLPPPIKRGGRTEKFLVHLTVEKADALRKLAESRGEPAGRVAALLIEAGVGG